MKISKVSFGSVLLILAALVNLARWVGVFSVSDGAPAWVAVIMPILGAISGLFSGFSVAGCLAFLAHRLGQMQPFTPKGKPVMRFWGALVCAIAILVLSVVLLPPYVRMTLPASIRAEITDVGLWSVGAVLLGDLIIVGVAMADFKSLGRYSDSQPKTSKPQSDGKRPARSRSAKKSKSLEVAQCRYAGAGCDLSGTQNAMNAHARHCKFKPIAIMTEDAMRR